LTAVAYTLEIKIKFLPAPKSPSDGLQATLQETRADVSGFLS